MKQQVRIPLQDEAISAQKLNHATTESNMLGNNIFEHGELIDVINEGK